MDETPHPANVPGNLRHSEERFRLLVESVRDYAIFMLDPSGHVLTWNPGAQRFKGYLAQEIIGRHFSAFYPAAALASGVPQAELAVAQEAGSFEDEGWRVRKDGSQFWANVVITAMRSPQGELVGFAKVTRDLTQRRQQEEALRRSEERFRLMVEGVSDYAIFLLDVNGAVATWNSGAQRIKGYAADEIVGRHFSVFYPPEARESGWPEHGLRTADEQGRFADTGWRVRKDGTKMWADVTITALRDDLGRLLGYAKLTRDLHERTRAEAAERTSQEREEMLEAERSARMEAQRATRIKDEFLATLSHELRTPLSAILGWTQLLLRDDAKLEPQQTLKAITVIDRNAKAQIRLIDELLDLCRIISGKIHLHLDQVSINDVVLAAVESAMPAARARDLELTLAVDAQPTLVDADSTRLQQVVSNLLTNAIKFTPKGGRIEVGLQRQADRVELSVSDSGIGIPAHYLPQVFDRFSQRDSSTTRGYGGLGLGLAISRQLVEMHGGSIRATSPGEGRGATFVVDLPLATRSGDAPTSAAVPAVPPPPAAPRELPRLVGVHAFVIDDEADARELLKRVFENQGAQVTAFASAEAALLALQQVRPALIVSDIGMPQMDGHQFMRNLRASESRGDAIPAIALSAFARPEDRKRSLLAGYHLHLVKPFEVDELVLAVASLVGR